jgi:fructose-1,6-bisphosphatase/inositol monophosphatase family enzyme
LGAEHYRDELAFTLAYATWAGERIRRIIDADYDIDTKADHSPVTTADHVVNTEFIDQVAARFPSDGVLGEEASHATGGARTWVIDPVDGTQHLILGLPVFMVSIALVENGQPVLGVAHNPSTRQSYWAVAGGGAHRDGALIHVSARDGTGPPATVNGEGLEANPGNLTSDTLLRMTTAPDLALSPYRYPWPTVFAGCKVAEGNWDGALYGRGSAHDVAAVCLLVREAGGRVTDRTGADQRYDGMVNGCVLSNGAIHGQLVRHWADHTSRLPTVAASPLSQDADGVSRWVGRG